MNTNNQDWVPAPEFQQSNNVQQNVNAEKEKAKKDYSAITKHVKFSIGVVLAAIGFVVLSGRLSDIEDIAKTALGVAEANADELAQTKDEIGKVGQGVNSIIEQNNTVLSHLEEQATKLEDQQKQLTAIANKPMPKGIDSETQRKVCLVHARDKYIAKEWNAEQWAEKKADCNQRYGK